MILILNIKQSTQIGTIVQSQNSLIFKMFKQTVAIISSLFHRPYT